MLAVYRRKYARYIGVKRRRPTLFSDQNFAIKFAHVNWQPRVRRPANLTAADQVRYDKLESVPSHCSQFIECRRRCEAHRSLLMAAVSCCLSRLLSRGARRLQAKPFADSDPPQFEVPQKYRWNKPERTQRVQVSAMFYFAILKQESLADAKVSARQQCVYGDPYRRNLQQICNWWLIVTVVALLTVCESRDIFGCRGWKSPFSSTILWL